MILRNTNITCIWRIQSHKNTTLKSSSGRPNSGESSPYLHGGRLWALHGCRDRRVPLSSLWYLQPWALDAYRFLVARGPQGQPRTWHPSRCFSHRWLVVRPKMPSGFRWCKAAGCWNPNKKGRWNWWWNILSDWWLMLTSIGGSNVQVQSVPYNGYCWVPS